jgi:hypothetical protein
MMRMTELHSSSGQIIDPENSARKVTCIRILCLHGKGGDGKQVLSKSLMPLRSVVEKRLAYDATNDYVEDKITVEWETITAPYALDPDDDSRGYSWWKMPPGMRSYNAEEVREMIHSNSTFSTCHESYRQITDLFLLHLLDKIHEHKPT